MTMGDVNQRRFLEHRIPREQTTVLEVGSKNHGNSEPFRQLLKCQRYVGLDMEAGPGVDVVGDLTLGLCGLEPSSFGLVICVSVLEHVQAPWLMAQHMTQLLQSGGLLYVAVPWIWRYHPYPDDYWRFSWRGVEQLFPNYAWEPPLYSTTRDGEFFPAVYHADNRHAQQVHGRKYLPYLQVHMLGRKP